MTSETLEDTFESNDDEFLGDAFRRFPIVPNFFTVCFSAKDIVFYSHPRKVSETTEIEHLRQCVARSVIPYSSLHFKVNNLGEFIPDENPIRIDWRSSCSDVVYGFTEGKSFYRIFFENDSGRNPDAFKETQTTFMDNLYSRDYILRMAILNLGSEIDCYANKIILDTSDCEHSSGKITITTHDYLDKKMVSKVDDWIEQLKGQYTVW